MQLGTFVKPQVDAGYRVLSVDAPAHGKSSGKQTNLPEIVEVMLALQQHYGGFDSVISHSSGGPCTAKAVQRGLKTSRVVSPSPPARLDGLLRNFVTILHIPEKAAADLIARSEHNFCKDIWHEISMQNTVREINIPALLSMMNMIPMFPGRMGRQSPKHGRMHAS